MNQKDFSLPPLGEADSLAPVSLPAGARFAFIEAAWHADIVQQARAAFLVEMARHGVGADAVDVIGVPGAFEIPLHAKRLIQSGRYQAIVACALVVDGGIYRHEFVAQTVVQALMTVQLDSDVPVISAVLTPHHFHEHLEHRKYFQNHFSVKGTEAARACVQTVASLQQLPRT
ncbi:6,7-dimethyl-8-ribityllumazine synthase [Curvibacter sp. HBC28]|uniref:6,7-dimethyl-8-ribityllumazine synthase n=1 Tax=Curvibacter microcysteis TaxID=3026419 RepID=A0ABT5MEF8_9BURK|nr:6,7-dimethyl-8-ribityllumazine synthase [Curvibacter sp. HBC28]MDD0814963.1 6,7-dimethyl-8-ribityllumazine synthase [Curvibacter sp. HBC28]